MRADQREQFLDQTAATGRATARRGSRSRGSAIKPRPIASICCSPPESVPARWLCRSARRGKIANTRSRFSRAMRAAAAVSAQIEILAHRHVGKDAAAFGHMNQAARDDVRRSSRFRSRRRRSGSLPRHGRITPEIVAARASICRRRWSRARQRSRQADVKIDAAQNLSLAVAGMQALHREQAAQPWPRLRRLAARRAVAKIGLDDPRIGDDFRAVRLRRSCGPPPARKHAQQGSSPPASRARSSGS